METNSYSNAAATPPVTESVQDALQSTKQALAAGQQAIEDITAMQQKVQRSLDWRSQFSQSPWFAIGAAAVGGMLLARLVGGRTRSRTYSY